MSTSSAPSKSRRVKPNGGCGTLESPWTGWESQLEGASAEGDDLVLAPGFYGVSRPVRLASGTRLRGDASEEGRAWFLAAQGANLPTLFLLDGSHDVTISGICFNGRTSGAKNGILLRCGTRIQFQNCRFGDFHLEGGAAIAAAGESSERHVRGVVVQGCRFVNGVTGLSLGPDTSDLLVTDCRFEENEGPALLVDPKDHWSDFGLIFVKNRIVRSSVSSSSACVRILPGAEGIRLAENTIEGSRDRTPEAGAPQTGIEIRGGGPMSRRRLELMLNRVRDMTGPGIAARQCGPGFLAAGNNVFRCGTASDGAINLVACHGVLVEDNEVVEPIGPGIGVQDCSNTRLNGNEVIGNADAIHPRGGSCGLWIRGDGSRRIRVTDNKICGIREQGLRIDTAKAIRVVGNEIEDCGNGIHVNAARNFLLVGNDCRDNGAYGIQVEGKALRGLVALNYAILNGTLDLEVGGTRVRCRNNKVDRTGAQSPALEGA